MDCKDTLERATEYCYGLVDPTPTPPVERLAFAKDAWADETTLVSRKWEATNKQAAIAAAEVRYTQALWIALATIVESWTLDEVDRAGFVFSAVCVALENETGVFFENYPQVLCDYTYVAESRIAHRKQEQKRKWLLYQEKQRKQAYVAMHKQSVYVFNKEKQLT